jgi:PAS domain-containing protein
MRTVQDFDGYTLSVNAVHQAVLGWSLDELSAVPFWELVHPDDQGQLVEDRERLVLTGPGQLLAPRVRTLRRDGMYRLIGWDVRADVKEERIYLAGDDISDRVSFMPGKRRVVGSWDWDITRDSATWSEGMFEIYGLAPQPMHNLEIALQRIHQDDRALLAEEVRQALTTGEPYAATHRIVRPDGAVRRLYSAGRTFTGEDGMPQRMRGLTWDDTDGWRPPDVR